MVSVQADSLVNIEPLFMVENWVTEGENNGVEYGGAVSSAGDINHDGYADIIVGAQQYLINNERRGAAFVFLGSASGPSQYEHRLLYPNDVSGSYFGAAVSSAGDVNGDGYDDIIIGAPHHHQNLGYEGAAYLYYGSAGGLMENPAWVKIGPVGDAQFGFAVNGVGDVNHDGYDDVLIGSNTYSVNYSWEGAVYLFLGSVAGLSQDPVWIMEGGQATAQLGYSVSGLGDINKDSYADFVISAPYFTNGEEDEGKIWVVLGGSEVSSLTPVWSMEGGQEKARFGNSVAGAGDVNGDTYLDLVVGASGYDIEGTEDSQVDTGAAFIYLNIAGSLKSTAVWINMVPQEYSGYGISVAGLGDVNEDGYDDIAVGAYLYTGDQPQEGFVFVYKGSPVGVESSVSWKTSGNKAETEFGYSVAAAGDINADGKADLIVGAPSYKSDGKIRMGRAYVFHGAEAGDVFIHQVFLPMLQTGQ